MKQMVAPSADSPLQALAVALDQGTGENRPIVDLPMRKVFRAQGPAGPVIVKLWRLSDLKGRLRNLAGRTKGRAEWAVLTHLHGNGIPVPEPIALLDLRGMGLAHHEALVTEDISPCSEASKVMRTLVAEGRSQEVRALGLEIVDITGRMVAAGIQDTDHCIRNFLVREDGRVFRIDFEKALMLRPGFVRDRALARMLGMLLGDHAIRCRKMPEETRIFAAALKTAVGPSEALARAVRRRAQDSLWRHRARTGITVPADLGW